MSKDMSSGFQHLINARYDDAPCVDTDCNLTANLYSMLSRGSCRAFLEKEIPEEFLDILCAVAFASPTKSDLQQRDVILIKSAGKREHISKLIPDQTWIAKAPMIAVFCGNNRRQRLIHEWHNVTFANDHLDAFLNAAADAAIALGAFVSAAEAMGLGCCPISAVRNKSREVSRMLNLPQHVFPFAGLAFGYPSQNRTMSKRLPLKVTCHVDQYNEDNLREKINAYDESRSKYQPYSEQRFSDEFGKKVNYGWSDDKVRQYSRPERADFGSYIREQGFCLD